MATIKSYTDLEQSKKLAEFLPIESADMCLSFVNNTWNPVWGKADDIYQLQKNCYEPDYTKDEYVDIDEFEPKVVSSWSLAALLNVLPKGEYKDVDLCFGGYQGDKYIPEWFCSYEQQEPFIIEICHTDNPVDSCYEMILKLHELKML